MLSAIPRPASSRHPKFRVLAVLVAVLAAWQFEFATHVHSPQKSESTAHQQSLHGCAFCAALQAGAGPAAPLFDLSTAGAIPVCPGIDALARLAQTFQPYRSRAPPSV